MPAISWNGYELDGSDTSFEVALPDIVRAREAVAAMLRHPLWDGRCGVEAWSDAGGWAPHRQEPRRQTRLSIDEAIARVLAGQLDDRALVLRVRQPVALEPSLLAAIASHSEKRTPHEPAYVLARRPIVLGDGGYLDPSVCIILCGEGRQARSTEVPGPLAGELLQAPTAIHLGLGPGFIYEYAMELLEVVLKVFPEAEVTGGLDCEGGWTWGCTYAASIYHSVVLYPELPAQEVIARVFDSRLLHRPWLRGGYEKIVWYKTKSLQAARDINFAGGGRFLIEFLEAPEARGLVPEIEYFINHDDQATREQYAQFCRDVRATALDPAAKRDLTLVYLCLPQADEMEKAWATELLRAQDDLLRPLYADLRNSGRQPRVDAPMSLAQRVCWLGLDPDDATRAAFWVRPEVALFAAGVLERVVGVAMRRS